MTFHLNVNAFYQNDLIGIYLGTIFFVIYLIIFQLSPLEYNYFLNNRNVVILKARFGHGWPQLCKAKFRPDELKRLVV